MTILTTSAPQKLRVFDTLGQSFSLWGRNFIYLTLLALLVQVTITVYLGAVQDIYLPLSTKYYLTFTILGQFLQSCVPAILLYGVYFLIIWRSYHQIKNPDGLEARQWLPTALFRLNFPLILYMMVTVSLYPMVKAYTLVMAMNLLENNSIFPFYYSMAVNLLIFIFQLFFFVLLPLIIIERPSVTDSIRHCLNLTRGNRLKIFGLLVIYGLIQGLYNLGFNQLYNLIDLLTGPSGLTSQQISFILSIQQALFIPLPLILWSVVYVNLTQLQQFDNPDYLKDVFE
ncbi:glycerophosphoryl diester phosphodiesterase membrane domain-containing protein [Kiloniella laminariae]|uniref:glycerophosphoryl diester phosphodiesterase membrane domain-containing protein n=1 Tax=Kiloniella laminariae TaxID=454162 RepID=UPI00036CBAE6|nr:glycerophosphoryl diester phosphodiesterase membrane domain-containing protein [Kiloniella laminariae]